MVPVLHSRAKRGERCHMIKYIALYRKPADVERTLGLVRTAAR
jgi:hypothetical protein